MGRIIEQLVEPPVESELRVGMGSRYRKPQFFKPLDCHGDEERVQRLATGAEIAEALVDDFISGQSRSHNFTLQVNLGQRKPKLQLEQ